MTATVPNLIRYSGTLKDAQGAISSSTAIGVTFAIYKQQDGGAAVWQEMQNVTPEANGQYSVLLGSTTATGLSDDVFSQQEQRWLGVQVQGQPEQARVMLVSVPYAFKAHEATLGGLPVSAFVRALPSDAPRAIGTAVNPLSPTGDAGSSPNAGNHSASGGINPLSQTYPYIPYWNGLTYTDSIMSQPNLGAIQVNNGSLILTNGSVLLGNGNVDLEQYANTYMIADQTILSGYYYGTSVGVDAGSPFTGLANVFVGNYAGHGARSATAIGGTNTEVGAFAGAVNITGSGNTFIGGFAGYSDTNASENTFVGDSAGRSTTGGYNTFLGQTAGFNNQTGDSNIYIGNSGPVSPQENNTIRIGTQGSGIGTGQQNTTYIAGVYTSSATPTPPVKVVCVDSVGLLFGATYTTECTSSSSRRFKENILDMGESSSKLFQLRPVTFFYKPQYDDGSHLLQYGLIAEEVAKVYPDMVAYDKDGAPYTVKYQLLAPMLLNELRKEHTVVMAQQDELQAQLQQIKAQQQQMQAQSQDVDGLRLQLQQQNASLQERLSKLESYVATQTQMKTASNAQPAAAASPSGDSQ